jgi:hypothetical protein
MADISKTESFVIRARKEHGEFLQTPKGHLKGRGCPLCNSSRGEEEVSFILNKYCDKIVPQKTFRRCKGKIKTSLRFDFMIKVNGHVGLVEFNGLQHYVPVGFFGGKKALASYKVRDQIKIDYCKRREFPLIILRYDEIGTLRRDVKAFIKNLRCPS